MTDERSRFQLNDDGSITLAFNGSVCTAADQLVSTVTVLEDAGPQQIHAFATSVSGADGYAPASLALFGATGDQIANGDLFYVGRQEDAVFLQEGLQYASDRRRSEGLSFFVEAETNSFSVWSQAENTTDLTFIDRRTDGEVRVRFKGFGERGTSQFDASIKTVPLENTCSLESAVVESETQVLAASGCDLIFESNYFLVNETDQLEPEWADVIAHWDFSTPSLYTNGVPMDVRAFRQDRVTQAVTCNDVFCRYSRSKNTAARCRELYDTNIGPATFRDQTEKMGAAVFVGKMECAQESDFDTPPEHALNAVNAIVSADGIEAFQFNRQISTGLYLTDDINQLVTGFAGNSRLPLRTMSIETWFSLGAQEVGRRP
eukprot:2952094-Rhodomonas_salina.1